MKALGLSWRYHTLFRQTPRSFLQQALPTPKISSGPAFYKRKLWTYNFCIHDTGSDNASMFVWPETIPGHGSHEMASCVLQYFKNTEVKAQTLHVYSDNCSGQNKNFNILSLWQYLVANGRFKEIRHIFPLSGHTTMPCDRDFGDIERKLQKSKCIYTPSEYVNHIKDARVKNKFQVTAMVCDEFLDVTPLANALLPQGREKIAYRKSTSSILPANNFQLVFFNFLLAK